MTDVYVNVDALDGESRSIKFAEREVRMGFVRKVYGILACQLLMTLAIAGYICSLPKQVMLANVWMMGASQWALIGIMLVMLCNPDMLRTFPGNYLFLFGLTFCEALLVGFVSATYTTRSVMLALWVTAFIFGGFSVYAWTTKEDFTGEGPYLIGFLIALCAMGFGLGLAQVFGVHMPMMTKLYCAGGVVLFSMFIVYDTQKIVGVLGGHKHELSIDDYVAAALMLYLDIINIFVELLQLLGDNR